MAGWIQRKSGKGEIDRAGTALISWWRTSNSERPEKFIDYVSTVFNWRACHSLPLNVFQKTLRVRASKVDPNAIVAQRLKRFASVMASDLLEKLELSEDTDLDPVLVYVPSINDLRTAYPNYYADTREFLEALRTALKREK